MNEMVFGVDSVDSPVSTNATAVQNSAAARQKIKFLGLQYDNLSLVETMERIDQFIVNRVPRKICTVNVTLLMWARKNSFLRKVYESSDILGVDGMAIYYASKLFGTPFKDSISASLLFDPLLEYAQKNGRSIYLVGAEKHVVRKAAINIEKKYPGINIVGQHHGFFDVTKRGAVVDDIREKGPDMLFVGMSSPFKEQFIDTHLEAMNVPVCLGVGGMFDIAAGETTFAPDWIRKLCMEWLYRLCQEPKRLWRRQVTTLLPFLWLVLKELFNEQLNAFCSNGKKLLQACAEIPRNALRQLVNFVEAE